MLSCFSSQVDNVRSDPLTDRVAPVTAYTSQLESGVYFNYIVTYVSYLSRRVELCSYFPNSIFISIIQGESRAWLRGGGLPRWYKGNI